MSEKWGLIVGFDLGAQQQSPNSTDFDYWLSPVLIARYQLKKNWNTAMRAEYYGDKKGVVTQTGLGSGLNTSGFSWNLDYSPTPNLAWRIEGRFLKSPERIFESNFGRSRSNFIIGTSLAIKFAE
jgi:hypothetical protein